MKILKTIAEVKKLLVELRGSNKSIGFVPTMGALHLGHMSLVEKSNQECDFTIVSIFVNPTQFNDKQDYELYPRDVDTDIKMLIQYKAHAVFIPSSEEIYPEPDQRNFDLGELETIMEGKYRPGHFQGVVKVVSKLFDIVEPDKSYFGIKDFQQLAVIRKMTQLLKYRIEIVGCPIVREANGLAMSSRNKRLTVEEFDEASTIFKSLNKVQNLISIKPIPKIKDWITGNIEESSHLKVEYVEFVDNESLAVIDDIANSKSITCCIAVFSRKVRLIDNIQIFL